MRKKGRPKAGEERKLTPAEIKLTRLDKGIIIFTDQNGDIGFTRKSKHGHCVLYDNNKLVRANEKLIEYWSIDNGNGK
jgi:hypothetical protein